MTAGKLRVGIPGAGAWAQHARIPGRQRAPGCKILAISDVRPDLPLERE